MALAQASQPPANSRGPRCRVLLSGGPPHRRAQSAPSSGYIWPHPYGCCGCSAAAAAAAPAARGDSTRERGEQRDRVREGSPATLALLRLQSAAHGKYRRERQRRVPFWTRATASSSSVVCCFRRRRCYTAARLGRGVVLVRAAPRELLVKLAVAEQPRQRHLKTQAIRQTHPRRINYRPNRLCAHARELLAKDRSLHVRSAV